MFEMLLQRSSPLTTLTPVPPSPGGHSSLPADLSPRSSNSSFGSSDGGLHNATLHLPNSDGDGSQEISAIQRLQYALSRLNDDDHAQNSRPNLIKPCQGSSSSSMPSSSMGDDADEEMLNSPLSSSGDMKAHTPATSPTDSDLNVTNIFQCPLCAVQCHSRHDFNEHLVTHSQQYGCPRCSFFGDDEAKLKDHLLEVHEINDFTALTDEEVRTPKTNSQGKVKTFKCKHCGHHAVTKLEFWEHSKTHMRQEKILTCPKCPFVTEYKHHLEYHLRNHFKSKPFQCTKCNYSCVNKSMLNSHLKSHSNIYQYRCADCAYATKYCHSLKLHLRKYDHKPSMVLNLDGTPNPLPIIDVYGTRRGPKIKRSDPNSTTNTGSTTLSPVTPKEKSKNQKTPKRQNKTAFAGVKQENISISPPSTPKESPRHVFKPSSVPQSLGSGNDQTPFTLGNDTANLAARSPHAIGLPVNPAAMQQILMQLSPNSMNLPPPAAIMQNVLMQMQNSMKVSQPEMTNKNPLEMYAAALNQMMLTNNNVMSPANPMELGKILEEQRRRFMSQLIFQQPSPIKSPESHTSASIGRFSPATPNMQAMEAVDEQVLDLRNPRRSSDTNHSDSSQEDAKKRKRKGPAFRYERVKEEYNMNEEEVDQVLDFSNNNYTPTNNNVNAVNGDMKQILDDGNYICKYCDIAFPAVLYALHMKFHSSDAEPFRCNACGTKSTDKVSFFVHLANASH